VAITFGLTIFRKRGRGEEGIEMGKDIKKIITLNNNKTIKHVNKI